jgi:hypothetical protein
MGTLLAPGEAIPSEGGALIGFDSSKESVTLEIAATATPAAAARRLAEEVSTVLKGGNTASNSKVTGTYLATLCKEKE